MKKKDRNGRLPSLLIIGAMKCGTTSLHHYLNLHPEIIMSARKELDFFIPGRNLSRGMAWYRSNFKGEARIFGESSPNYTNYPVFRGVAETVHSIIPGARLIYVVRDPVDRIISHYIHFVSSGQEHRPIEDAVNLLPDNPYLVRSKYYMQLGQFLRYFPMERILVLDAADLKNSRDETMRRVFRFLGVADSFASWRFRLDWHQSKHKRMYTAAGVRMAGTPVMAFIHKLPFEFRGIIEKMLLFPASKKIPRPNLPEQKRHEILACLDKDLSRFADLTGIKTDKWVVPRRLHSNA